MKKNIYWLVLLALGGCHNSEQPAADAAAAAKGMEVISKRQKELEKSDEELKKIMASEGSSAPKVEKK
ncbi:hypothetical protein [Pseudoduganella sp. OTU4001]|uniref:hypothetical protein n=1 Tax=Pseudoduganella sp. OTU4001 TaxID=3043854 RepID=UPI00313CE3B2